MANIKDISYSGIAAHTSAYSATDGTLDAAINLVNEDGALRPIGYNLDGGSKIPDGYDAVCTHSGSSFHNIIFKNNSNSLFWSPISDFDNPQKIPSTPAFTQLHAHAIVGNILVLATDNGMIYIRWKGSQYAVIGTKIPDPQLAFELEATPCKVKSPGSWRGIVGDQWFATQERLISSSERKAEITNTVMGAVNTFVNDATEDGYFTQPFFVRYALRLFDGSIAFASSPILMRPMSHQNPVTHIVKVDMQENAGEGGFGTEIVLHVGVEGVWSKLLYKIGNAANWTKILNFWGDIVASVDIFISAPLFTYNQAGELDNLRSTDWQGAIFAKTSQNDTNYVKPINTVLSGFPFDKNLLGKYEGTDEHITVSLPPFDDPSQHKKNIAHCHTFFLAKSIPIDELTAWPSEVDIPKGILQNIQTQEPLEDEYTTDQIVPKSICCYNKRLSAANYTKKHIFELNIKSALQNVDNSTGAGSSCRVLPYIFIKEQYQEYVLKGGVYTFGNDTRIPYFFYPHTGAYNLRLIKYEMSGNPALGQPIAKADIKLVPHDFLNGAFFVQNPNDDSPIVWQKLEDGDIPTSIDDAVTSEHPGGIYTSESNNPFVFPFSSATTVGNGEILGITTAVKALSQGQFGSFPLYAFTTEGVWALSIAANGTYQAVQPVARDVCLSSAGITQIDDAVLFTSSKGIMMLRGSETSCISDPIFGLDTNIASLPHISWFIGNAVNGWNAESMSVVKQSFLQHCRMVYDYANQRIIAYNPCLSGSNIAFIFALKSSLWSAISSNISHNLNTYSQTLVITNHNAIVDLAHKDSPSNGAILVTRPLKLDAADIHKTIDCIIQRGNFQKGHVQSVLYGSRDLRGWHLVWSSKDHFLRGFRGTPYKYFRIALLCNLAADESIYGASVQFTPRLTNQPR